MKATALHIVLLFIAQVLSADNHFTSIHQSESLKYKDVEHDENLDDLFEYKLEEKKNISHKIFAYHPHWATKSQIAHYNWNAMSDIGYFSAGIDTSDGHLKDLHNWTTASVLDLAKQHGVAVHLVITNFGSLNNRAIINDTWKRKNFIVSACEYLKLRDGKGISLDFENVPNDCRANLSNLLEEFQQYFENNNLKIELSIALPAVDWNKSFDIEKINIYCDFAMIMGYDYYYGGSKTAGPVAPLKGSGLNISKSVDYYLENGIVPDKLMLIVPWYGRDWEVESSERKSKVIGKSGAYSYTNIQNKLKTSTRKFDIEYIVPWIVYETAKWHQLWYDDIESLTQKYAYAKQQKLRGIGIWAASYGNGDSWKHLGTSFQPNSVKTEKANIIKIYPNPCDDVVSIKNASKDIEQIIVYSITGQRFYTIFDINRISMHNCMSGVYIFKLINKNGEAYIRFVHKK